MAVSADGYVARKHADDMSWLGGRDKSIFKLLTGVGGMVALSSATAECMPKNLTGRTMAILSRKGRYGGHSWGTLDDFNHACPDGWLIGGQTLALLALNQDMVDEVHLCRSDRFAFADDEPEAVRDGLTPWLQDRCHAPGAQCWWQLEMTTRVGDVRVECWRRCVRLT